MSFVVHRVSKSAARYTDAGGREKCGYCRFFIAPRTCGKVIGPVSPQGWCKYFSRQVAQQYSGAGITGGGGPPGATLSLDFMSSGNMPPGITFTRASSATYTDASGVIQTAAANQPRWDYAGGSLRGLLIEEARTNLIVSSVDFSGFGWSLVAATIAAGQAGAPDGTSTFTRLIETSANSVHYVGIPIATLAASTLYTLSVYAKAQQSRYLQLAVRDGGGTNGAFATFDVLGGTITGPLTAIAGGVIGTASIQPVGNGVFRCSMATTVGALTTGSVLLLLSNTPTPAFAPGYVGNASNGLQIWGAQLEQGSVVSTYTPTGGTAATRAAEVCYLPIGPWYNSAAYSLFAECVAGANINSMIAGIGDATPANGFYMIGNGALRFGVGLAASPAMTPGAVSKICGTVTPAQVRCCINGAAIGTAGSAAAQTTATRLSIGGSPWAGDAQINAHLRRIGFWTRVLSDTEIQQVTT